MKSNRAFRGCIEFGGNALSLAIAVLVLSAISGIAAESPASITVEPISQTVIAGCTATFTVSASGSAPITFQWLRNGTPLTGESNASLTLPFVNLSDSGTLFQVAVSNAFGGMSSAAAVLAVAADVTPPALEEAGGDASRTRVYVRFKGACSAHRMDRESAEDPLNYGLSDAVGNPLAIVGAALDASGTLVTLTTAPQDPGVNYTLEVHQIADISGNLVAPGSRVAFRARAPRAEALLHEAFVGGSGVCAPGNCHLFPCSTNLWSRSFLPAFDTAPAFPEWSFLCARVSGYFIPPISGEWIFHTRGDDVSQLYVGTNGADRASIQLAVEATWCCLPFSSNASARIYLRANQPAYIEGLGRSIAVAARLATDATPPDELSPIPSEYLVPFVDPSASRITILRQPADIFAQEGSPARLEISASVEPANPAAPFPYLHYQWQRLDPGEREWKDIPGATTAVSFTPPEFLCNALDPTRYRCQLFTAGSSALSAEGRLTTLVDGLPPDVAKAVPGASLSDVTVTFTEFVTAESAGDLFNYRIDGLEIIDVTVLNPRSVRLRTERQSPGAIYSLIVNGIHDLSDPACGTRGEIWPNTVVRFQAVQRIHGAALRQIYRGLPGFGISALRASPRFPDQPDQTGYVYELDGGTGAAGLDFGDDYGMRLSGFLCPTTTQRYDFYIASDDQGEFWLSTDESPANLALVCQEFGANEWRNWPGFFGDSGPGWSRARFPDGIALEAGKCYYFEALMKELAGPDHIGVTWTRAGDPVPAPGTPPIGGEFLASYGRGIEIRQSGGELILSWNLGSQLHSAPSMTGPWTLIPSTTNRLSMPAPPAPLYFRSVDPR